MRDRGNMGVVGIVAGAALLFSAVAGASTPSASRQASGTTTTAATPTTSSPTDSAPVTSPSTTISQGTSTATTLAQGSWPTKQIAALKGDYFAGHIVQEASSSSYAITQISQPGPSLSSPSSYHLALIDLANGSIQVGSQINAGATINPLGSDVAIMVPAKNDARGNPLGPWHMEWLVPGTTQTSGDLVVPQAGASQWQPVNSPVAERASGYIWAYCSNQIFQVNLATGAPSRIFTFTPNGTAASSSTLDCSSTGKLPAVQDATLGVDGYRLYVSVNYVNENPTAPITFRVFELSVPAETIIAKRPFKLVTVVGTGPAVPGGVWAGVDEGMGGSVVLLSNTGLTTVGAWDGPANSNPQHALVAALPHGTWLLTATDIACAQPGSSKTLASETVSVGSFIHPFAELNGHVYATEQTALGLGILAITPPAACNS